MQDNNRSFVRLVRYIYDNHPTQERYQIDSHLLSLDYDPGEIDRAWKVILVGQGPVILQDEKQLTFDQILSKAILVVIVFCGCCLLVIAAYFGWVAVVYQLKLPEFLA